MLRFLLLGSLWLAVCRAQFFTMPDALHNYTDMISFMTQKFKYRPRTTTKRLNCTPGEDEHFDYMMNKYERDFGSQLKDEDFTLPFTLLTTTGASSPDDEEAQWTGMTPPHDLELENTEGTGTVTKREITITELVTGLIDETYQPEHKVLQMIKELANKGLRVYAKLKDINTQQKEEHFPWKYMTQHQEYQEAATRPPPSPVTFQDHEAKAAFKNKTEERVVKNLMSVLKDCMDAGEEKKKELLKRTTPTSAEEELMREYYRQTKQDAQPEYKDYTTWDGGEGHVTLTPSSVEREILPHQTFKKYDTLEIYHDAKAKEEEAMELEEYEHGIRPSTTTTEKPIDFNGTITINWAAMSEVMWHYITRVTLPAKVLHSPHTTHIGDLDGKVYKEEGHVLQNSTMISAPTTEGENQLLEDYLKYLTEVGQTVEPDPHTTNFLVERFPKRLSSDEVAQKKLYTKSPHFVEKFPRRLDSVEMKKRQSRLSTTPTTTTATWAYTTFAKRTYNSIERERIEEFFQMNNISADPEYFGTTTTTVSTIVPITTSRVTIQTLVDQSKTQTSRTVCLPQEGSRTTDTKDKVGVEEREIYRHIDVPQIQSNEKLMLTTKNRTMSYHELSSVVSYYAELLRMKEGKSLYFSTASPVKIFTTQRRTETTITSNMITTPEVSGTKIKTKPTVEFVHEDAHAMTEAPLQHVFNLLFNPFRHDLMTQTPCSPVNIEEDNFNDLVKSLGSTLGTEHFNSSEDNQLQEPNMITTPRVYSKGDVYAMGHKVYQHGDHDPMWRSNYGGYESTTTTKSDLLNVFDDPLGLYMRPDTEELKERELNETLQRQEAEAKLDNITHYAYWKELNKKYFNLTSTIFPGQFTPRNENQTPRKKERTIETIYSEEHYIETQSTTPVQEWTGYNLENETMDPFPDAQEIANQLGKRDRDPLDPEHILEKRLLDRDLEDQIQLNEDDMPNQSYMNMSFSDQLCVDRAPAFRFFDDSQQFESKGYKTIEGFHSASYEFMAKAVNREVELTRQRFAERAYNKSLDEAERRRTMTTPSSMEKQGLRMDNIKFRHLDDEYQGGDMDDFKVKLKQQLGGIYARPSSTTPTFPTTHLLVITNKGGKVIRRLKKIKRRKHTTHTFKNNVPHNNHEHDPDNNELKEKENENNNSNEEHLMKRKRRKRFARSRGCHFYENVYRNDGTSTSNELLHIRKIRGVDENFNERKEMNLKHTEPPTTKMERFGKKDFSIPLKTTKLRTTINPKWNSVERKFHGGQSIHIKDMKEQLNPSLEQIMNLFIGNLTAAEAELNKTITEEEREIDEVSEKNFREFGGDIPGFERDYEGNLVPTRSPDQIEKDMLEMDRQRIEHMRKARGEFNKYVSQETYDQQKDAREIRMKHMDEYFDYLYQQEKDKEMERRRMKASTNKTSLGKCKVETDMVSTIATKITKRVELASAMKSGKQAEATEDVEDNTKTKSVTFEAIITETKITRAVTETSTQRSRMIERFPRRQFTLPFERNHFLNNIPSTTEDPLFTMFDHHVDRATDIWTKASTQSKTDSVEKDKMFESNIEHDEAVNGDTTTRIPVTSIEIPSSTTTSTTTTLTTQKATDNTLVEQLLGYKQFVAKYNIKKRTKTRDYTLVVENSNRTREKRTTTTPTTIVYSYEEYDNISTTVDILACRQHKDGMDHLTDVPANVFDRMKAEEQDLYMRYHNGELSEDKFREMRNGLIEKYIVYAKSTTRYTHPTFNITVSRYPELGEINDYGDLKKVWEKVKAFERKNLNNTLYKADFSLAFTNFPPTVTRRRPLYKRDLERFFNASTKRSLKRKSNSGLNNTLLVPDKSLRNKTKHRGKYVNNTEISNQTSSMTKVSNFKFNTLSEKCVNKSNQTKTKCTRRNKYNTKHISNRTVITKKLSKSRLKNSSFFEDVTTVNKSYRIKNRDKQIKFNTTKIQTQSTATTQSYIKIENKSSRKSIRKKHYNQSSTTFGKEVQKHPYNPKKEIKGIQKQLAQLQKEMAMLKDNLHEITSSEYEDGIDIANTDEANAFRYILKNKATDNQSNGTSFVTQPFLYVRHKDNNGSIDKYEIKLKWVTFDDDQEVEEIKNKFIERDKDKGLVDKDILVAWRNVTANSEEDINNWMNRTKDWSIELEAVHPHTLVTMVSDLYHKRMSLQNHIQYETTTLRADPNRTYLYQVFGFNSRTPKRTTRNATEQFSLFQNYRSTIQDNFHRVSDIQAVLEKHKKNLTIFSKRQQRLWDVFFYEKNIPQPRHAGGPVRVQIGYAPAENRVKKYACNDGDDDYDSGYSDLSCDYRDSATGYKKSSGSRTPPLFVQQLEFKNFMRERKPIRTTDQPMVFAWQQKSSLPLPTEESYTLMNPDPTAKHFLFEFLEPP